MKNVIITGANSGLGFEILACRNEEKAARAKSEIISATGNEQIVSMKLDTSLLASARSFAEEYIRQFGTVDVLINNAGISPMRESGVTEEGFEIVFATNYLGHFLLTQLLLPHFNDNGRIINVSSDMHNPPGGIEWKGIEYLAHEAISDRQRYAYSKLCMIYFTHKLAELLKEQGSSVTVNSFNPGFMATTNFTGGHMDKTRALIVKATMPERYGELETSSDALARIATDPQFGGVSGLYYDRSTNIRDSSDLSYVKKNQDELWQKSLEYSK